jgi:methionyl-tRNA formyltransferase
MKIIYFGTSEIGIPILLSLVEQHQIVAIVTAPDKPVGRKQILTPSPIAQVAMGLNLPILTPSKVKGNTELLEQLKLLDADIFIVVSYGKILPMELLEIPRLKTLNVHFSLLPKYRGPAPVQFALLNGETTTGSSVFILDAEVDHGLILSQKQLTVSPDDTNPVLQTKLAKLSSELLLTTLRNYEAGSLTPQEQDHSAATFTKIIKKEDGQIDWSQTSTQIYNTFRAFQPWPGIYTKFDKKLLKIVDCKPAQDTTLSPGQVSQNIIGCGNKSSLEIISLQLEGKQPTQIKNFLNGYPNFANTILK